MSAVLTVSNVTVTFGGSHALNGVDFVARVGEIQGLVGQNGAGKSTLTKVLAGVVQPDSGSIRIAGSDMALGSPRASLDAGIRFVHQDLGLVADLDAIENVALLNGYEVGHSGPIHWRALRRQYDESLRVFGFRGDSTLQVGRLDVTDRVATAITRAVVNVEREKATVVVFDEVTAGMHHEGILGFHRMMKNLCDRGMGVVYISHHLRDILDVSDYVTVLRNGSVVARDITTIGLDVKELVGLMVGEAGVEHPAGRAGVDPSMSEHRGDEGIRCSEVTSSRLAGIKFTVNTGEVLGIYGVDGSGREDIGNCLVGELGSACIEKNGELPSLRRRDRTSQRPVVRMLARDRLSRAAISQLSVRENLTLPLVGALAWHGFLSKQQERRAALEILATVSLHLPDVDDSFITLSGGMQQRALLGRALAGGPDLLILDEPTQGVDVVSRVRIHDLIRGECVRRGLAVLVITSDEEEAVTVCDRVLVVNRGRIVEEFLGQDAHVRDIREAAELTVME